MHMMSMQPHIFALTLAFAGGAASLAQALELVMVERKGCVYCEKWDAEVAPEYPLTNMGKMAPLRRVDIDDVDGAVDLERKVIYTPTFLFVDGGSEVSRLEGYISEDFFWALGEEFVTNYQASAEKTED